METNLRPMSLGEILDRTAQLYRSNFLVFAGIFSFYWGVALVLNLLLIGLGVLLKDMHLSTSRIAAVTLIGTGVEMLILLVLVCAPIAAISRAVAWVNLGEPATVRAAYSSILPRLPRFLGLMTVTALIVYTPIAILYGAYFGMMMHYVKGFGTTAGIAAAQNIDPKTTMTFGIVSVVFILLLIPAAVYTILMALRYCLAPPACVVENLGAVASLSRSVQLSQGARGRIFILGLLIGAIKIGLGMVTQIFFFVEAFKQHGQISPGQSAISQLIAFFTNTFLGPIYATGITLFYYDQRVRKEGYDIEWMMEAAGLTRPGPEIAPETLEAPAEPTALQQPEGPA